jgi:TldD protein
MTPLDLRSLATRAIEAATQAGATYADVRIGERHRLQLTPNGIEVNAHIISTVTYGVRVLVDGAWALVHGIVPSVDAVTTAARDAVAMAKGYTTLVTRRAELAPAPVAVGEWATPMQIDPFAVPLREHSAMIDSYIQLTGRYPGTWPSGEFFHWTKETRVFASSEGSLVTQTLRGSRTDIGVRIGGDFGWLTLKFPAMGAASGGYETLGDVTQYADGYKALIDDVNRYKRLPERTLDVGRYPVVVDGATLGMLFGRTVGLALELDRVLGYEADASGTSYLAPPLELLGTPICSPQLTVTATRAVPTPSAARWDDDGVETQPYPVIQGGRLVDYHTSRSTAPALRTWYELQGQPVRSHGCAVATEAGEYPMVRTPHLTMNAGQSVASLETLYKDVKEGVLVLGLPDCSTDQMFASSTVSAPLGGLDGRLVFKIERGKIVHRLGGNGLLLSTRRLWKEQLVSLGDATTVQQTDFAVQKGMPWQPAQQSTTAPAALFKDVDVMAYIRPE